MEMVKYSLLVLLLGLTLRLSSQPCGEPYLGFSISDKDSWFFQTQYEENIGIAFLRLTANTNFTTEIRLDMKMAFRVFERKHWIVYAAMPPLYFTTGKGYITPFNFEVRYKDNFMLNLDIYRDTPVFTLGMRFSLLDEIFNPKQR